MKTITRRRFALALWCVCIASMQLAASTSVRQPKHVPEDKFRQLEEILPTPNLYRTASGAPARGYWQQRADYQIQVELDDDTQHLRGTQTITYHNHSPDRLSYLWLQLDQNILQQNSDGALSADAPDFEKFPYKELTSLLTLKDFDGGFKITRVADAQDQALPYHIVKTMLRIDLPKAVAAGESVRFSIDWHYPINDAIAVRSRSGYEYFSKDKNYIYEIAQWYPRMAAYTDVTGWQHKQFLGRGEFTLELGDYEVAITVPADHIVAATGVLQNPEQVLSKKQRERLQQAQQANKPLFIVTPKEAARNEQSREKSKKTWLFKANNVRDFAFASSRKFIWDAQQHNVGDNPVLAMSFYPNEAEPLWSQYSTHAIMHTLDVYSRYTFQYPYPVCISVNGPVGGMEYPMISFNQPRPDDDKTYWGEPESEDEKNYKPWEHSKYGLISVIIHEVGHNYFPMIVNSDERQWTWMDEGLNTFLQFLAEQEWQRDYPSQRGEAKDIVEYMAGDRQVPIMTNSESILKFGNNAYAKPATALNILRETILGRELFDFAFKEYAQRWKFKRPMPADFFRSMEDASGVDLDWFWRGWFYSTDHVDIAIDSVHLYTLDTLDPEVEKPRRKKEERSSPRTLTELRNRDIPQRLERFPELKDFYNHFDEYTVTAADRKKFKELLQTLDQQEQALLKTPYRFYTLDFRNIGGLVMPLILQIRYQDGSEETVRTPAEIWRHDPQKVSKLLLTRKEIQQIVLDPHLETADVNTDNNYYPSRPIKSRFQLYKQKEQPNPMQEK